MESLVLQLIVGGVCGIAAAAIASGKGRNATGWFFGGFFLGIIGIIIVAVLSNKKKEAAKWQHANNERRRLREQLRQERIKNEHSRRHITRRLDAHDGALEMNTRDTGALPTAASEPPALKTAPAASRPRMEDPTDRKWYYCENDAAMGPVRESALRDSLREGRLSHSTLVWREGMENWAEAAEVSTFRSDIQA
jgi:uncharacterized membrane protein YeaQ/YmgE (transglycosylase-associated protein family)